ncbi:hypothetical protein WM08_15120 [Burkholderia ubonensis]|uniref:hypothetical protein n=1 Tax=Burkholderia ubonensis TaxID=101571 RepID=UPI00075FD2B0|nr:hypothetical protein [Burkholderia ubonensis]KWI90186.1 hypothetical protein WM08_15120 [Burkholderia ubonensis]
MAGKNVDWIAIEAAYRANTEPVTAIAAKHGISHTAINKRARAGGWIRNPGKAKRAIVEAHFSGAVSTEVSGLTRETIQTAANDDIADMERGLRVHRLCLKALEKSAEGATEPKEIKVITEAAALAITGIRKIRGLDTPTPADAADIDAAIEAELAQLERRRQAGTLADAEGEEPA